MTESPQTKVCPLCAETIKAAAKVCPFCQNRQDRWSLWAQDSLPAVVGFFLLGISVLFVLWLFPWQARSEGRSFAGHRSDLKVLPVALDRAKTRPEFWLSGFVTNTGAYPWRVHELEVRFLDGQGHLFDVLHPAVENAFVVEPGREHAFRVKLGTITWTNNAALPQVRVQTASDGHLPPKD
jgi:hypothetical protein